MVEYNQNNRVPAPNYQSNLERIPLESKQVPVCVKIISVLYYINAAVVAIVGILIIASLFINSIIPAYASSIIVLVVAMIFTIGFFVLFFFMGRGLWRGQNWARITAAIFAIFAILIAILSYILLSIVFRGVMSSYDNYNTSDVATITSIFNPSYMIPQVIIAIVLNGIVAGYLLFSNKVKEAFK